MTTGAASAPVPRTICETCGEFCPHACAPVVPITRERWTGRRVVTIPGPGAAAPGRGHPGSGGRVNGSRARDPGPVRDGPGPGKGPGCRCAACTAANRQDAGRRARLQAYGQWRPYVPADPARAHVQALAEAGVGWKRAAELAGISTGAMSKLLYGGPGNRPPTQRVRPETAAAILAVKPEQEALAPAALTDATGTHRRVQALAAAGWSQAKIGQRLGMSPANFATMMRRQQVTAGTAAAARAVYDELWKQPPPEDGTPGEDRRGPGPEPRPGDGLGAAAGMG